MKNLCEMNNLELENLNKQIQKELKFRSEYVESGSILTLEDVNVKYLLGITCPDEEVIVQLFSLKDGNRWNEGKHLTAHYFNCKRYYKVSDLEDMCNCKITSVSKPID